jgi:hypothetical protein
MSEAIAALVGVALTALFTLLRDWLGGRRDDKVRWVQAAAERVRFERDIIGELLVGLHLWITSLANRKYAFDKLRSGQGEIRAERYQKYHADAEAFAAILSRARVSVQNPAARPYIRSLQQQLETMSLLMNLVAEGREVSDFEAKFVESQEQAAQANRGLEEAALQWDGVVPSATAWPGLAPSGSPTPTGTPTSW